MIWMQFWFQKRRRKKFKTNYLILMVNPVVIINYRSIGLCHICQVLHCCCVSSVRCYHAAVCCVSGATMIWCVKHQVLPWCCMSSVWCYQAAVWNLSGVPLMMCCVFPWVLYKKCAWAFVSLHYTDTIVCKPWLLIQVYSFNIIMQ